MNKRFFLAISLSMAVLWVWSTFLIKPNAKSYAPNKTEETSRPNIADLPPKNDIKSTPIGANEKTYYIRPWENLAELEFEESQAIIKKVIFNTYQNYEFNLVNAFLLINQENSFRKLENVQNEFVQSDVDKEIFKRFNYRNNNYYIELEVEVRNISNKTINFPEEMSLGRLSFEGNQVYARFQDVVIGQEGKNLHFDGRKSKTFSNIKFIGLRDRYFSILIQPENMTSEVYGGYVRKIGNSVSEVGIIFPPEKIDPNKTLIKRFAVYLGPQEVSIIKSIRPEWTEMVYFGFFNSIAWGLLNSLTFINKIVHNWGVAIILLSILINILLFPITMRQVNSMKKMQEVQPEMEKIKKLYKDNQQKMHMEIMALYKKHHLNPLGGCLFGILQWPLFIAFLQGLSRFLSLKGASFLWIKDLAEPDKIARLPMTLPLLGGDFNLLPLLVAFGYFVQQKMSTVASEDKAVADQQKMMTFLMPGMFCVFFYSMPSGVVLYWLVNTVIMILMLHSLKRKDGRKA